MDERSAKKFLEHYSDYSEWEIKITELITKII